MKKEKEYDFKIVKKIGEVSRTQGGWTKELNLVSWNGSKEKYDLREWSPDHKIPAQGITLTKEEFYTLKGIMSTLK